MNTLKGNYKNADIQALQKYHNKKYFEIRDQILRILIKPVDLKYYWDIQGTFHEHFSKFIHLNLYEDMSFYIIIQKHFNFRDVQNIGGNKNNVDSVKVVSFC